MLSLALLAGNLLFFLTVWMASKYDKVTLDQFIYQMKSSAAGANRSLMGSAVVRVGVFGVVSTLVQLGLYRLCAMGERSGFRATRFARFVSRRALALTMAILIFAASFFTVKLDLVQFVNAATTESGFIEDHYVDPNCTQLTFPQEKRNLVYIFLESMEVTFAERSAGGPIYDNFLPELTALAEENVNFSNDSGLGGALSFSGTTWTAAAMVTQTSGLPVQVPLDAEYFGGENGYMPGVVSIGEILEAEGYNQTLLVGSDAEFGGRDAYFTEHGNYNIVDMNTLKERGWLPKDYRVWWGFEDAKLFAAAKLELSALAAQGEPFNFTMLTCDTHFPDGYYCQVCQDEYPEQYPTVMRCSSRMVWEFVNWIREQPFYENTTIVISGDHLTMDPDFLEDANEDYLRTVYNCIINPAVEPVREKNREFGTFDLFPTTLAAMGVEIEGDRLGLGTNLFSEKQTLCERYGYEALDWELQKRSEFYNKRFLGLEEE
jgi:phosphoglycerol transferase